MIYTVELTYSKTNSSLARIISRNFLFVTLTKLINLFKWIYKNSFLGYSFELQEPYNRSNENMYVCYLFTVLVGCFS